MDISIDTSELRNLVYDLNAAPLEVARKAPPIVKRGAVNIKNDLQSQMAESVYFHAKFSFDITDGGMGAEIGPEKSGAGNLAAIAYWGGSNGGGGTVEDPQEAVDREDPNFYRELGNLLEGWL